MAVQERYRKLSLKEKKRRRAKRKSPISPESGGFYVNVTEDRPNERIRYWNLKRYRKLSLEEKKRRRAKRKSTIAPESGGFYVNVTEERPNERIESAVNRRAAGVYVRNF